ncbi:hypothetical protein [uncultured Polaribacter sp.]|uniref:hypothetical protein n=1 Tax=uncultured Polaribacter sp. TaxID=174711 RepID=UPI0026332DFE|nr:hypothetical protein [uncultured Polaribacter sp.]
MKNKADVFALKEKSKELYEKLSVLAFVEEYVNTTPNLEETKETLTKLATVAFEIKQTKEEIQEVAVEEAIVSKEEITNLVAEKEEITEPEIPAKEILAEAVVEEIKEQPFDELERILSSEEVFTEESVVNSVETEAPKQVSLEEELKDTISVDEMATLFDLPESKSLNDTLNLSIQIGLNDRIAFVKNLFNDSQEDFNRVMSQLNSYNTEKDAKKFISKMVKPDYNWEGKEDLETRFLEIITRKFA